jgi:aryl-alcohol dehydrogenase-like predicted oxidoreductase
VAEAAGLHRTPLEEPMQALADIVRQGKVLYIGVERLDGRHWKTGPVPCHR